MDSIRDERRTVTVVFADLVGSTALAERLDPEEVRLIVGEAVARMVRAVEAYGGTVKDLELLAGLVGRDTLPREIASRLLGEQWTDPERGVTGGAFRRAA